MTHYIKNIINQCHNPQIIIKSTRQYSLSNPSIPITIPSMLSSLNLTTKTELSREQSPKINIILRVLLEHNQAHDFKQPVDWKGMNLNDYPNIVKHPMDLETVGKNYYNNHYHYVEEFLDHVQLIWDNCKLYNMAGSWIYQVAQKLERTFKKMIKNYFPDIPCIIPQKSLPNPKTEKRNAYQSMNIYADEDITYLQKLNFCERVQKLDEEQLEKLIKWIEEKCPYVLKDVSEQRTQIFVDNFTQDLFNQASELLYTLADGQIDRVSKKVKLN